MAVGPRPSAGVSRHSISRPSDSRLLRPRLDARRCHLHAGQRRSAARGTPTRRRTAGLSLGRSCLSGDSQLPPRFRSRLQLRLDEPGLAALRLRFSRGHGGGTRGQSLLAALDAHLALLRPQCPRIHAVGDPSGGFCGRLSDLGRPSLHNLAAKVLPV